MGSVCMVLLYFLGELLLIKCCPGPMTNLLFQIVESKQLDLVNGFRFPHFKVVIFSVGPEDTGLAQTLASTARGCDHSLAFHFASTHWGVLLWNWGFSKIPQEHA